ncbi:MAG: hypothetical protein V1776_03570 [Candidatus Diapherotrites archaeon]
MPRKKENNALTWRNASFREFILFKLANLKSDRRIILLQFVEMTLAVLIAASIAIYLDPDWNVVPFPWNGISFIILVGLAISIHRGTRPYRLARKMRKKGEKAR